MRGKISGFETRLRAVAPHLCDIDGDQCHHVHNSAQKFCSHFHGIVEKLMDDLHTDFKWCTDIRESFKQVCIILGSKLRYSRPACGP
jgi:hypothetical protein